jgi:uncharacterized protein (TIGR03382 family)
MRFAVLCAVLALPLTAAAGPFKDVIKHPPRRAEPGAPIAFTNVSRTLYLNPCLPNGCTLTPGNDDSRINRSSIPEAQAQLIAWPHGQIAWDNLVKCVKDMYAPFDIQVTDVDPGTANHFEVMMAGNPGALGLPNGVGGVAPFIACNGNIPNNVISFVFAAGISNQDFLCWAAAQESAHVWGLDHELNAKDPMTYLTPPIKKEGFQNTASPCGEEADQPRECQCGGTTQNSYQYLMDTFGPANLEPASMAITEPADGAWVRPGFNVKFAVMSQLSVVSASLKIDGAQTQSLTQGGAQVFATPNDLAGGDHTIAVTAKDTAQREVTSQITVHVTAKCDAATACAKSFNCLGGFCLPGADVAGGLGSPCTNNGECVTGVCGGDGTNMLCTGACDAGSTCPSGYSCLEASGGAGVCWPNPEDDGGCSTSGGNSPLLALLGLGALVMLARRRK